MERNICTITFPSVFMHTLPDISSEVSDELLYGTHLEKIGESGDYIRCETGYGYSGYVHKRYLSEVTDTEKASPFIVSAVFADLLAHDTYKYRPVITLPKGSIIHARHKPSENSRFAEVLHRGHKCYIPSNAIIPYEKRTGVSTSEATVMRKKICDAALMYLGSPYRWGGKSPSGIDCSGLCFMSYFLNGLPLWRDAYADKRYVHEIPEASAKQGDLIYLKGHAAIYIGDGEYVHSSASAGGVTVSSHHKSRIIYRADLADKFVCFARSNML